MAYFNAPERVYVNTTASASPANLSFPPASFAEARNAPIVGKASDYNLSVIRFQAQGVTLPVFIPPVKIGQSNPNLLQWSVALGVLCANGSMVYSDEFPLTWTPPNSTVPTPQSPLTGQDLSGFTTTGDSYYSASSMQLIADMINQVVMSTVSGPSAQCVARAVASGTSVYGGYAAPVMLWNAPGYPQGVFTLVFSAGSGPVVSGSYSSVPPIVMALHPSLASIMDFSYFYSNPNLAYGAFPTISHPMKCISFGVNNTALATMPVPVVAATTGVQILKYFGYTGSLLGLFYVSEESTECHDNACPVDAIVFRPIKVPCMAEAESIPTQYGYDTDLINDGDPATYSSGNFTVTTTDLGLPLTGGPKDVIGKLSYAPTAEYRWIQLLGDSPVSNMDFNVAWRMRNTGTLFPLFLQPNGSISMKILLQAKG